MTRLLRLARLPRRARLPLVSRGRWPIGLRVAVTFALVTAGLCALVLAGVAWATTLGVAGSVAVVEDQGGLLDGAAGARAFAHRPAFGAARLARLAATGEPVGEVCWKPEVADVLEPERRMVDAYRERGQHFRSLYRALRPEFAAMLDERTHAL